MGGRFNGSNSDPVRAHFFWSNPSNFSFEGSVRGSTGRVSVRKSLKKKKHLAFSLILYFLCEKCLKNGVDTVCRTVHL